MNKTVKQKIKTYLIIHPETRDNDQLLISHIWTVEIGVDIYGMSAESLLNFIGSNTLTSPETIVRHRRKLQEDHEHLRGEKYNERQNRAEIIRQTINN